MQDNDKLKQKKNKLAKGLGNIIKQRREKTGKSIYLISAESTVPRSTWRDIEFGNSCDINLSTFCKISEGLDVKPYELLKELYKKLGEDFSFTDLNK